MVHAEGSNVVRKAPLSAALANGDDTLSIMADCYSIAAADAALAAALLAYYTSSQVDALLVDYRTGTAQDAETTGAISAALLAYYTSTQVVFYTRRIHANRIQPCAGRAIAARSPLIESRCFLIFSLVDNSLRSYQLLPAQNHQRRCATKNLQSA